MSTPEPEKNDSGDRTYSRQQVIRILTIARTQNDPRHRWVPWLLAHSGMRIGEVQQLEKEDLVTIRGRYFLHIKVGNGRTTKTGKARHVPVHNDVITGGFCEFVDALPHGRMFTGKTLTQAMSKWIKKHVVPEGEDWKQPPSQAFRHFMEDLMATRMTERSAQYVTGRAASGSVKEYGGGEDLLFDLSNRLNELPGFYKDFEDEG